LKRTFGGLFVEKEDNCRLPDSKSWAAVTDARRYRWFVKGFNWPDKCPSFTPWSETGKM
jgi:hypothetical protein